MLKFKPLFAFFLLLLLTSCDSSRTIVNKLSENEANEIIVYLGRKNIDAAKVQSADAGGAAGKEVLYDVTVPKAKYGEALSYLVEAGLPRRRGQSLLEIFKQQGLVPSEMTEKIKYQAGLGESVANTIRKFDGILDADVQFSFPEDDPLNPGKTKGDITASVYIKHSGVLDDPNSHLISRIKRLVQSYVTGLKYDNVTIVPERTRFSEVTFRDRSGKEEQELVSVWSILIAKESLSRFRILFFSFLLTILLLIIGFVWFSWKIYPLMQKYGGLSGLFHIKPLHEEESEEKEEEESEEKEEEKEEKEEEGVT